MRPGQLTFGDGRVGHAELAVVRVAIACLALVAFDSEVFVVGVLVAEIHEVLRTKGVGPSARGKRLHAGSLRIGHAHVDQSSSVAASALEAAVVERVVAQKVERGREVSGQLTSGSRRPRSLRFQPGRSGCRCSSSTPLCICSISRFLLQSGNASRHWLCTGCTAKGPLRLRRREKRSCPDTSSTG